MDALTAALADNLFAANGNHAAQMESLATQALTSGITKYQKKDYDGAAADFKRAFGLSPYATYAYEATKYAAMSYRALGEPENAIKAYEQALTVNQTDDRLQLEMGNLLYRQGRTGEAIEAYEEAVRLYDDPTNRYALGQGYLNAGRYSEAENQFDKIIDRGGAQSRNGHFGMGQALRAQKKYEKAIEQFEIAIHKDRDFFNAYEELGYTYADAGMMDQAEKVLDDLENEDRALASLLNAYIDKSTKPKIKFAYANSSFPYFLKPKSHVAALDDYMANANATKSFAMEFQFNKAMDRESIEKITNWTIKRSSVSQPGMNYNFGVGVPDTEITPPLFPTSIYYDEKKLTATVRFDISQNADANGTIDPSHIVFSFSGEDSDGNEMDVDYDEFMGFSGSF